MTILGALIGIVIASGGAVLLYALTAPDKPPVAAEELTSTPPSNTRRRLQLAQAHLTRQEQLTIAIAAAAGLVIALSTGWILAIILLPLFGWGFPRMVFWRKDTSVATLEALEEWTRGLSSLFVAGNHITQTLAASRRSCPKQIRPQVDQLVNRIQAGQSPAIALYAFADDIDDETGDGVASALIRSSTAVGGSLGKILTDLADMTSAEVKMRRQVIVAKSEPRGEARAVSVILLAVSLWILLLTDYGSFYFEGMGQLVLLLFVGAFAALTAWINSIIAPAKAPRFLVKPRTYRSQ